MATVSDRNAATTTRSVDIRRGVEDGDWDRFVASVPGGHYTQSTSWARYKATSGWEAARATVSCDGRIVAGTQVLIRPVRFVGAVGYAFHGPVLAEEDDDVAGLAMDAIQALCRRERVRYLVLQPSEDGRLATRYLLDRGFVRNDRFGKPSATARVDLTPEPDAMLAGMRRSTRANIRRGLRRGLLAREGGDRDLDGFLELYARAARRKGFTTASRSRYRAMWSSLRQEGLAHLFLVESGDEVVSAQLGFHFGETFYSHMMAWSASHGDRKPNELLDWTAMMWARDHGCRWYDFEGIEGPDPDPARSRTAGADCYISDYKRGFGARVVPIPGNYDHSPNPVLRWCLHTIRPRIEDVAPVRRLERRLMGAVSGRLREGTALGNEAGP